VTEALAPADASEGGWDEKAMPAGRGFNSIRPGINTLSVPIMVSVAQQRAGDRSWPKDVAKASPVMALLSGPTVRWQFLLAG